MSLSLRLAIQRHTRADGAELGLVRLLGLPADGPVLLLLDGSGSLAGEPLASAVRFAAALLEQLDPERPAGIVAFAGAASLVAPLVGGACRLVPTVPGILARCGPRGRADLGAACRLARVELERVHGLDLAGCDLLLVSDLIGLEPGPWEALGAAGARLRAVRVPTHLPDGPALAAAATLAAGQETALASGLASELQGPPRGRLVLRLSGTPARFLSGAPGRWRRGPVAGSAELALDRLVPAAGFVGRLGGQVRLELAGAPPVEAALDPAAAKPVEPSWTAELEALL